MLVYNTLSGKKEDLDEVLGGPPSPGLRRASRKKIRLFVCGPTVYDYIHIGNGRTYAAFDNIVRYLRYLGYKVFYLQNITDIDDKIIRRANEKNLSWKVLAKIYKKAYHEDEKRLGIISVTKYAPAAKYIKEIVRQARALLEKGHAYKIEGDGYYFDIKTFPEYGKLSKRTAAQAEDSVSRIDESVNKRNRGDFALWKFSKKEEPVWDFKTGAYLGISDGRPAFAKASAGRPGWHIEDTAITECHFGPQYDVHGAAADLIFPHHEAEIAQQESASGKKPFVKIWMHSGFLNINQTKMSKSYGGFITVRDFLGRYSPAVFRYLTASHHYRMPLNYSDDLAEQAKSTVDHLAQFIGKLNKTKGNAGFGNILDIYDKKFRSAMDDDFNSPEALAAVFALINEVNPKIWDLNKKEARAIAKWVSAKLELFGIRSELPKIPLKIRMLAKKRELYRGNKQFIQSDRLRKEMEALGYTVEDTPIGPFVWPRREL